MNKQLQETLTAALMPHFDNLAPGNRNAKASLVASQAIACIGNELARRDLMMVPKVPTADMICSGGAAQPLSARFNLAEMVRIALQAGNGAGRVFMEDL